VEPPLALVLVPAERTADLIFPFLGLLGAAAFFTVNSYRCVVATDRRILVLDAGRLTMGTPKPLLRVLPRPTRIGPVSGPVWYRIEVLSEVLRIHLRFHQDIGDVDALASTPGDKSPLASPPAE